MTIHHMKASLHGALRNGAKRLIGCVTDERGRTLTSAREIEYELKRLIAKGDLFMAMDNCTNFDPKIGCLGCPDPSKVIPSEQEIAGQEKMFE